MHDDDKVSRDLYTAFSGKGVRGLVHVLNTGGVLTALAGESEVALHNDRIELIQLLVGEENYGRLLTALAGEVVRLAKQKTEGDLDA